MRIALLDENPDRAMQACRTLRACGHDCQVFAHAEKLLEHLRHDTCDLLIIDWQAQNAGPALLREIGNSLPHSIPVLLLTDRSADDEIARALDSGAADYLVKPLRLGELTTRVRILLKRAYPEHGNAEEIRFGQYAFDAQAARVTLAGKPIGLTQKEFDLALLFFHNLGRPLSRAFILDAIWSGDHDAPSRSMDTHVSRVRSKLGLRPENGFQLVPVYSYGYRLEPVTR
jgi:DNA-binding response OmpR family regulator